MTHGLLTVALILAGVVVAVLAGAMQIGDD